MKLSRRFLLLPALVVAVLVAAPLERELGFGLVYVRVHALPDELPTKPAGRVPPCVVDVRYVRANDEAAAMFLAWVRARATPRTPVFVLANADTSASLVKPIAGQPRGSGVVVVGLPAKGFEPDIAVKTTADHERRAYNALEQGTPIARLLADNPDKVRNDEASLSKDRLAEASAEAAEDALTGKRDPVPVDATLQRAVHLHRALVALRKI